MKDITNQVILKDGKSVIGTWSLGTGNHPTIGDRIDISAEARKAGYGEKGEVTKVEFDRTEPVCRIEVEADCPLATDQRPVIALNQSMFPEKLRESVEDHVRSRLEFPVLEWEESYRTTPIVRVHEFNGRLKTPLDTLQAELRDILTAASELSMIP